MKKSIQELAEFLKQVNINAYVLLFAAMLYITCKLVCNPLFFRQIDISLLFFSGPIKLTGSAFFYPAIYILSDLITALSNRRVAIVIAMFGIFCDGFFSFCVSHVSYLVIPSVMSATELLNTNSVDLIGKPMWQLYYQGVMAATFAAVFEILMFSLLFKRIKNFIVATVLSVVMTLVIHNLINDYQMLKHEPDVWKIIIDNWIVNVTILFVYAVIISGVMQTLKIWRPKPVNATK